MSNNFYNEIARKKLGKGDDWEWFRLEAVGPDMLVTGGVSIGEVSRGPDKGAKKWDLKTADRVVITKAEIAQYKKDYEEKTGDCGACQGQGKVVSGWSKATGTKYRDCRKCKGSGKANV